ncbi:MAG: urease accessory protein UreD [Fusobacterium sp.]|nr:urease accessory protein UreD [Fusobacterium sp.]
MREKITIDDLGKNNLAGYTELILQKTPRRTSAKKSYTVGAAKVSPAIYLDDDSIPCYYLIQLGGGYIEGEYYENNIKLEEESQAILTTQASSKIYKSENGIPSKQYTNLQLEKNSKLEFINDSVILYKDAVYEQTTDIYLNEESSLIYSDGITAGWSPDGKLFQYTSARLKTNIYLDGELIYLDNLKITPKDYDVQSFGILEGYKNFGTMLVIDKRIDKELIKRLREETRKLDLDVKFGISLLEKNGFVVRVLGNLTQDIQKVINRVHTILRKEFYEFEELDLRKY